MAARTSPAASMPTPKPKRQARGAFLSSLPRGSWRQQSKASWTQRRAFPRPRVPSVWSAQMSRRLGTAVQHVGSIEGLRIRLSWRRLEQAIGCCCCCCCSLVRWLLLFGKGLLLVGKTAAALWSDGCDVYIVVMLQPKQGQQGKEQHAPRSPSQLQA